MYRTQKTEHSCAALAVGAKKLAALAARAYATGKGIQYCTANRSYQTASSYRDVLEKASFNDPETARAAAVLCTLSLPEDGCKTLTLLLAPLLEGGNPCELGQLLEFCQSYLSQMAQEHDGRLPGGGLTCMTLIRPVHKFAREHNLTEAEDLLRDALMQPLLSVAQAAGAKPYEVYERIKALAPNQFYSLHQVGIERSISTQSLHTDVLQMGIDVTDGNIKDLMDAGIYIDLAVENAVFTCLREALAAFHQIVAVI